MSVSCKLFWMPVSRPVTGTKTRIYKQNIHTHTQSRTENSLFQFWLTITKPFPPSYLEEMKNYLSLSVSRTISQLIMRVRKSTVAYKLVGKLR